jgi:hypothetical protein
MINRTEQAAQLQSSGLVILLRGYGVDSPVCTAAFLAGDLTGT